ncbi:MAG: translation initiation factor IF-2, partial [Verrucomicrobiota bacterium]
IRKGSVVTDEAGGITQHIGAYKVKSPETGETITFIDTPGHAAFSAMREMGANVTDIAVLVVAADDGFMPQTDEALKFARKAQNAIVVAINKIDAKGANIDRVKNQMQERGIAPEDWGGDTLCVPISALKEEGIDSLLEMIALQSEIMELKANPNAQPQGIIIESQIEQGKGATATVIMEKGTLKRGDAIICGTAYCRVRSLTDDQGAQVKGALPGTPVSVTGWSDTPFVGTRFESQKNERGAKKLAEERLHSMKVEASNAQRGDGEGGPATIDDLFAAIENQQKKCLRIIVKSDVSGSLAAIRQSLMEIKSDKVDLEIVSSSVGHVTKKDVTMATTSGATIFGFNTRIENGVQGQAKHHGINIYQHSIIYELLDLVTEAMTDLLEPEKREKKVGRVEVRALFSMGKKGTVAGCMVIEGVVNRNAVARVLRKDQVLVESKVDTLRRFKDDVSEVRAGYECGVHLFDFNDYEEGDIIEVFEIEKIRPKL